MKCSIDRAPEKLFMQAQFLLHAMDAPVNIHVQSDVVGQNGISGNCRTRHCVVQCATSTRSTYLTLPLVVVLLFMLPLRSLCISSGFIDVGFTGSAMAYVDTDGDFLYSPNSIFTLSFFSSINQTLFYLCIIHTASQEIVWTANRDAPLSQSDQLVFSVDGNMALVHGNGSSTLWSSNTTGLGVKQMHMLDSGNLVLTDAANSSVWQSFDHPTDTLLNGQVLRPGMHLTSSTSESNMSSGLFSLSLGAGDLRLVFSPSSNLVQAYWSMLQDARLISSATGSPSYALLNSTGLSLVRSDGVVLSSVTWASNAALCRASLQPNGNLVMYVYSSNVWTTQFTALQGGCALPLFCGTLGICKFGQCSCPNPLQPLNTNNIAQGCHGLANSPCINSSSDPGSRFVEIGDGLEYFANGYMSPALVSGLDGCKNLCMQKCSCTSFFFYMESEACYLFTQLGTIQSSGKAGHVLYMKTDQVVNASSMDLNASGIASPRSQGLPSFVLPLVLGGTGLLVLVSACAFLCWFCKMHKAHFLKQEDIEEDELFLESISGLPTRFTFKELQTATNNFSKKLGEGGFGSVYEGALPDKTKVAVKRLEGVGMGQGTKEFRAEVAIIGRIHHVHLVQLCGFCNEGAHRLLVYEFLANGSLDKCLFGEGKKLLDWKTRFQIALGTARGLAYLHDDCREKIIHCDIKPENILLDENYNAKVSDFGMAKLVSKEQSQVFTTMRGTRGYLAPEWLMNLAISEKSDVYSFGMVLLEIISGRKNLDLTEVSEKRYFPIYAFEQAEKDRVVKLADEKLKENICGDEVIRAVKVALWCIQEEIVARPSMANVVQMLEGNLKILNPPLSTQFSGRGHAKMVEAMESPERSSSSSSFTKSRGYQSAVQLSEAR